MQTKNQNEERLIQYLLGQLSEQERSVIEERYFNEPAYYERLKIVEAELTDAYVNGQLAPPEREAFEKSSRAMSGRHKRIIFAEVWREYIENLPLEEEPQPSPFFSWLKRPFILVPLTAALLIAVVGVWIWQRDRKLTAEVNQAAQQETEKIEQQANRQLDEARKQSDEMAKEQQALDQPTPTTENPPTLASFVLNTGTIRGSGAMQTLAVHPTTATIELILPFKDETHKRHSAVIEKVGGAQILSNPNLTVRPGGSQKRGIWRLPAKTLPTGDYLLTLRGQNDAGTNEDLAEYQFRVSQK